jgi:transposase
LLYGDESEALTHPYLARAWAQAGADLRVPAPGQAQKIAMLGSFDHLTRQLIVHTSPTKRSSDFVAHLEQLDRLYGPKPGQPTRPVVLVEDNGPIHTSKLSLAALAARAHWLVVEWLPKYAPELNDIERACEYVRGRHMVGAVATLRQLDVDAGRFGRRGGELHQPLRRGDLAVLQLQPLRLDHPEQLLDNPAKLVPADNLPGSCRVCDCVGGQQPPVQRLHTLRRIDLPHLDQAQPHAASHIRVGTFQYFAALGVSEALRRLADYVIGRHVMSAESRSRSTTDWCG